MSVSGSLQDELSKGTTFLGLQLWVLICICVVMFIILILSLLYIWLIFLRKSNNSAKFISEDIKIEAFAPQTIVCDFHSGESISTSKGIMDQISENWILNLRTKLREDKNIEQCSSIYEDNGRFLTSNFRYLCPSSPTSPLIDFPVLWGHWFTKRDLELATKDFSKENIIGEGGYGVVYRGQLADGTEIAVKRILNNTGQAEKEFRVEVEAIGHVRHNNLVRLLGYCIEGIHRMLVYEYVDNGNLEQWLHGNNVLSWEFRMKIIHGTARALSYLHEAIEPKVVHRDIKASNILVDKDFNAKVSDFGLAKLLGSDQSHVTTRVMGTFGYVAPEYAESGLLNEGSDVYSFGVLLMELITGRDPMDYSRPTNEVNIVEWIEMMIENQMVVEVVDPKLEDKPVIEVFEGTLQVALTCVDLEPNRRPKMSQVLQMLETMV